MIVIEETRQGVPVLQADGILEAGGAAHGFSTRLGGVSQGMWSSLNLGVSRGDNPEHVRENYRRFFTAIGVDGKKLVTTNQVHGGKVRVADCIPVLLYDPVRRVAAAVHAGWRGTAAGIAATAVERMKEVYDCRPEDILAAVGPGIGPCCFETHEDVPNAMMAAVSSAALPYVKVLENGKFSLDLKGINARLLERAGLDASHIAVCQECTACMAEKYWSHRRMGNNRGSMAAAIQLL